MWMSRFRQDEPQSLYRMEEVVSEEQVKVGVPVQPDVTAPFGYVPFYFDKTIHYRRHFALTGYVTIKGEQVHETSTYSYGLEPIQDVIRYLAKLGIGDGRVTLEVTDDPIVLLPEQPREAWQSYSRQYLSVPGDWYNVSTPEGQARFDKAVKNWNTPWAERTEHDYSDDYKFVARKSKHTLWSSDKTPQENYATIVKLLKRYKQEFKDADLREILGLPAEPVAANA
jgi:hypothetical protein